jgi:long-chain fatty acid transport protein
VLLFAVLSSAPGHAAGFYTTTSGAKALGRGGAYTAGVDDLSAQFHNPAGLVRIGDPQIMLDISWVEATSSFHRDGEYTLVGETESHPFEEVKEEGAPFPIPSLAFGTHFGLEDWTFAIGFYPHYAPHQEWPEDGAQRYSLITSTEWQAYGGPTVAHRFNDWLSIGLGLQWTFLRADRVFALSNCVVETTCGDDPTYDMESSVKSLDPFTPSANLGVLVEPSDRLSLGLLFQLPISYSAKAKVTTHIPEANPLGGFVDGNDFTDEDATLRVDFPLLLKAGAELALSERVKLELDAGYQGWSRTQQILLTDLDITIPLDQDALDSGFVTDDNGETVVSDDVEIPAHYVDSYSVHLGSEWATSDKVELRAGAFFETSAVPTEWYNVTELDANKVGVGIGASWKASKRFAFDVALARNQFLLSDVTDSKSAKVVLNIPPECPDCSTVDAGDPVANGTYDTAITIGSLGATYSF